MTSQDEYKVFTIREFAALKNLPEPTVRSRIRLGKYMTVPMDVDGKQVHGIRVKLAELSNDDQSDNQNVQRNHQSLSRPSSITINPDYQQIINAKDDEIKSLREQLEEERADYRRQIDELRSHLEAERIKLAEMRGEVKRIDTVEELVGTQKETISSQKTTIEALNNERIVITQQLQKYRSQDDGKEETAKSQKKGLFSWMSGK